MSDARLLAAVNACLEQIQDPCSVASASPMNLVEMGLIREVEVDDDGNVTIGLRLTAPSCMMISTMTKEAKRVVGALDGIATVEVEVDDGFDWSPEMIAPAAQRRRRRQLAAMRSDSLAAHPVR